MKSPAMKIIPKLIALALSSSLMIACANQDGNEQMVSPASTGNQPVIANETTRIPVGSDNATAQINNTTPDVNNQTKQVVITEPEQHILYFGFDKTDISQDDVDAIQEQADFLKGHTEVVVAIDGHTDYHGPHSYNEQLSKKRADTVAKILLDAGVPESQLLISAFADSKPLKDRSDTVHNRRVELHYKDGNLASSK